MQLSVTTIQSLCLCCRAVFKFEGNHLKAAGTGKDFKDFKASFSNEDRGFGYIRINVSPTMISLFYLPYLFQLSPPSNKARPLIDPASVLSKIPLHPAAKCSQS